MTTGVVITDEVGGHDLIVTRSADWTSHPGDLPNGDASASLSTTLYENAFWPGEEFCFTTGSGTIRRTFEFWVKPTDTGLIRTIAMVRTNGTAITGTNLHWEIRLEPDSYVTMVWNTTAGNGDQYMQMSYAGLEMDQWNYIVITIDMGSVRNITMWINDLGSFDNSGLFGGTPTVATSNIYEFYLGARRTDAVSEMTDHFAKVAVYDRALTEAEMDNHRLSMLGA